MSHAVKLPGVGDKPSLKGRFAASAHVVLDPPWRRAASPTRPGTGVPADHLLSVPARGRSPHTLFALGATLGKRGRGAPSLCRYAPEADQELFRVLAPAPLAVLCSGPIRPARPATPP